MSALWKSLISGNSKARTYGGMPLVERTPLSRDATAERSVRNYNLEEAIATTNLLTSSKNSIQAAIAAGNSTKVDLKVPEGIL
jgi:hypothetical protein